MKGKIPVLAAVLLGLALLACSPSRPAEDGVAGLAELREKADREGVVRVIAQLKEPDAAQPAMMSRRADALAALEMQGVAVARVLGDRPLIVAEVTRGQLDTMAGSGNYQAYVEDRLARPMLSESVPLIQAPEVWAIGGRGQGQAVAILDTGVDATHPFLAGKVTAEACFSSQSTTFGAQSACPSGDTEQIGAGAARPCNASGCEHGTHVAGIAAGRGAQFSGVAPDAEIVAVQVFSRFVDRPRGGPTPCRDSGQASPCIASFTSDQIRGLDHVLRLAAQRPIAAANMSLGGGRATGACDSDLTKPVIDQLRAAGVAVVIAAGNDGFPDSVSMPGCISTAITVGATSKQDQVASFSNRGPQVDVLAPGVAINSSVPGGQFAAFSGTSMATPHVAGAFAALRSLRPEATLDAIERALKTTGVAIQDRPRIALFPAAQALPGPALNPEAAMAVTADAALERAVATFESMSTDQPVRVIAKAKAPPNATGQALTDALAAATAAARSAGIRRIEPIAGQAMLVLEATPNQAIALARSGAVSDVQVDAAAQTQAAPAPSQPAARPKTTQ